MGRFSKYNLCCQVGHIPIHSTPDFSRNTSYCLFAGGCQAGMLLNSETLVLFAPFLRGGGGGAFFGGGGAALGIATFVDLSCSGIICNDDGVLPKGCWGIARPGITSEVSPELLDELNASAGISVVIINAIASSTVLAYMACAVEGLAFPFSRGQSRFRWVSLLHVPPPPWHNMMFPELSKGFVFLPKPFPEDRFPLEKPLPPFLLV